MERWTDRLSSFVSSASDRVKDVASNAINKDPLEKNLREATSDKNWGCASTVLGEIAKCSQDYGDFMAISRFIWEIFAEKNMKWRRIYKTLVLVEYLLRHGNEDFAEDVRENLYKIRVLVDFRVMEDGRDRATGIREKSKFICDVVNETSLLKQEREKARSNRNKYVGVGGRGSFKSQTFASNRESRPDYKTGMSSSDYFASRSRKPDTMDIRGSVKPTDVEKEKEREKAEKLRMKAQKERERNKNRKNAEKYEKSGKKKSRKKSVSESSPSSSQSSNESSEEEETTSSSEEEKPTKKAPTKIKPPAKATQNLFDFDTKEQAMSKPTDSWGAFNSAPGPVAFDPFNEQQAIPDFFAASSATSTAPQPFPGSPEVKAQEKPTPAPNFLSDINESLINFNLKDPKTSGNTDMSGAYLTPMAQNFDSLNGLNSLGGDNNSAGFINNYNNNNFNNMNNNNFNNFNNNNYNNNWKNNNAMNNMNNSALNFPNTNVAYNTNMNNMNNINSMNSTSMNNMNITSMNNMNSATMNNMTMTNMNMNNMNNNVKNNMNNNMNNIGMNYMQNNVNNTGDPKPLNTTFGNEESQSFPNFLT